MADDYRINGRPVSYDEWQEFTRLFDQINSKGASPAFLDGEMTDKEMDSIIDLNGDGLANFLDVVSVDEPTFKQLKTTLKNYGFNAYNGIFKNDYLARYIKSEDAKSLPIHMWKDLNFCVSAIRGNVENYFKIDKTFLEQNPSLTILAVRERPEILKDAPASHKDMENVVLNAVRFSGTAIEHASDRLKAKDEIALTAMARHANAIIHCDLKYRTMKQDALKAVQANGLCLRHIDNNLRANPDVVRVAVAENGLALEYALGGLNDDDKTVRIAIGQNGVALKHASNRLKSTYQFCKNAVSQNGLAISHCAPKYRSKRDMVFTALKTKAHAIEYLPQAEMTRANILRAIDINADSFRYIPVKFIDRDIVIKAVSKDGFNLRMVYNYKDDYDIVMLAVRQNGNALEYASDRLKKDEDIALTAVREYGRSILHVHDDLLKQTAFRLKAIKTNPSVLIWHDDWMKDEGFARRAVAVHPWAAFYIPNGPVRTSVWNELLSKDRHKLEPYFEEKELTTYATLEKAMSKKYNIDSIRMFATIDSMAEALQNRRDIGKKNDGRPTCIIALAKHGAGEMLYYPMVDRIGSLGYKVMFFEAESDMDIRRGLATSTANGRYKADEVMLMMHGEPDNAALGDPEYDSQGRIESGALDIGDFLPVDKMQFGKFIKEGGHLTNDSCSVGAGGSENPYNLANAQKETLPKDVTIEAPLHPIRLYQVDKKGGRLIFRWDGLTWQTQGKRNR